MKLFSRVFWLNKNSGSKWAKYNKMGRNFMKQVKIKKQKEIKKKINVVKKVELNKRGNENKKVNKRLTTKVKIKKKKSFVKKWSKNDIPSSDLTIDTNINQQETINKIIDTKTQDTNEKNIDNGLIIKELQGKFTYDVYDLKYINATLKDYGLGTNQIPFILSQLWYRVKKWYVIKKEYKNFGYYLDHKIKTSEIIHIDQDLVENNRIYHILRDYCSDYELFKITDESYLSWITLNKYGINSEYIEDFFSELKSQFSDKDYFSIKHVKNKVNVEAFEKLWFEDEFLENIIFYNHEISTLRINNYKLFSYNSWVTTIGTFIEVMMWKYRVASLDEFIELVNEEFGITLSYDAVKYYTYEIIKNYKKWLSNLYYNPTFDKLYSNVDDFYDEVYNYK